MAGYALSPAARADIGEIWDYTVRHWGEAQAERYTRNIRDACEALGDGTLSGRSAEDIRAGYRRTAVGSHVMFYRVHADVVEIIRILRRIDSDPAQPIGRRSSSSSSAASRRTGASAPSSSRSARSRL